MSTPETRSINEAILYQLGMMNRHQSSEFPLQVGTHWSPSEISRNSGNKDIFIFSAKETNAAALLQAAMEAHVKAWHEAVQQAN